MSIIIVHGHIFKQIFVSTVVHAGYYKLRRGHKKEGVLDIKCVSFSLLFSPFIMPSILSAFLRHEKLHRRGTTPEVNVSLESASSRAAAGKFFFSEQTQCPQFSLLVGEKAANLIVKILLGLPHESTITNKEDCQQRRGLGATNRPPCRRRNDAPVKQLESLQITAT